MPLFQNPQLEGNSIFWKGNSTGVLLIHGFTATTAEVRWLAEYFRKTGFTVSAPLLPGHGTNPEDLNAVKYQDWISCVCEAYLNLKNQCSQVIVGGESMGAVLGLYLGEVYKEIDALLLYSPAIKVSSLRFAKYIKYFAPFLEKSNNDPQDTSWQGYTVYPLKGAYEFNKLQKIVINKLSEVHQPALILQGIHDKTIDIESGKLILDAIQSENKSLKFMHGSGHVMLLEKEIDLIIKYTTQFLKSVEISFKD